MATRTNAVYHRRRPMRMFMKVVFSLVLFAVVLAIVVFFWFQQYIVYTSEGVRLDIPFLDRGEITQIVTPTSENN